MDIGIIASGTISLLVPYLAKLSNKVVGDIGEELSEFAEKKIRKLYETIKTKFQNDTYASDTLERLKTKPQIEIRQKTMEGILLENLEADTDFASQLQKLLEEAKSASGGINQSGNGVIADNNSVAAGHGGYAAGRDINITKSEHSD